MMIICFGQSNDFEEHWTEELLNVWISQIEEFNNAFVYELEPE